MKTCKKCGVTFESRVCKPCTSAYMKTWAAANHNRKKEINAIWRAANHEKLNESRSAWRAANTDKIKARNAAWYAKNQEEDKVKSAAWYAANTDKAKKRSAVHRAENPEARRVHRQNRRALIVSAGGKLSAGLTEKLFELQKGRCACCLKPLGDDYHLDHRMPLALGGSNTDDNMQLLTAKCNMQKSAKHPVKFMQERGFLI